MQQNGALALEDYERLRDVPLETVIGETGPTKIQRTKSTYFTEEVRRQLIREVGERDLYHGGLTVRATIDDELQAIAAKALRRGLEKYDRGRGIWRGPITTLQDVADGETEGWRDLMAGAKAPTDVPDWLPAIVLSVGENVAIIGVPVTDEALDGRLPGEVALRLSRERQWIRRTEERRGRPRNMGDIVSRGDVVLVKRENDGWALRQIPGVQGAFMAMDPHSGRVLALQGGFSFDHSAFNRATQASAQPGSSFKPFIYAAALDMGYQPRPRCWMRRSWWARDVVPGSPRIRRESSRARYRFVGGWSCPRTS